MGRYYWYGGGVTMVYHIPMNKNDQLIKRTCYQKVKHGAECVFIRVNRTEGIKIYPSKICANFAIKRQRQAYKYGIAPKVLSKVEKCFFDIKAYLDVGDEYCYFYKTQVAKKIDKNLARRMNSTSDIKYFEKLKEMDKIRLAFKKLGWSQGDFHSDNLGKINGKMVVIDFGEQST